MQSTVLTARRCLSKIFTSGRTHIGNQSEANMVAAPARLWDFHAAIQLLHLITKTYRVFSSERVPETLHESVL